MRAFISSTYSDLKDYRERAILALRDFNIESVLMESNALEYGDNIIETIKTEIQNSDLFILIIGYRYGQISESDKISWIEKEFLLAKELGKPTLVFMLKEAKDISLVDPGYNLQKTLEFRERIQNQFLVSFFSNPADFHASLSNALSKITRGLKKESDTQKPKKGRQVDTEFKNVRVLKMLLSSPGDVNEERESVAKLVFRYNQENLISKGVFIKLIRWEDMAPQIGPGPQNVINNQIDEYDIFAGVMWNRFGTPTDIAASGTEEEFNIAIDSFSKKQKPWITFYFGNKPSVFRTSEQLEQKNKVLKFKEKLMSLGVIIDYDDLDNFSNLFYKNLGLIVDKLL